eukprot:TRINITY_DN14163_c0_g1_i1.p1 TRINITY_DN14163_c0_g1~~TRINITY_DN14163_c0_g1_i1.p1  ORF type:complete len:289 (+),score=74.72 TRINITY_DN14163_c0_g1_i1:55-921(+)
MEAAVKALVGISLAVPGLRALYKTMGKYGSIPRALKYAQIKTAATDPIFLKVVTAEKRAVYYWRWGRALNTIKYNYAYFWEYNEQLRRETQFGSGFMNFSGPRGSIYTEIDYGIFNTDYVHPIYGSGKWTPLYTPTRPYVGNWRLKAIETAEGEEEAKKREEEELAQEEEQDPLLQPGLAFMPKMNQEEAVLVLGLAQNDMHNERKIKNAYKKAMFANHPDKGGSKYIALKLSEAKDYLLKTIDSRKDQAAEDAPETAEKEGEGKETGKGERDAKSDSKKKQGGSRRR